MTHPSKAKGNRFERALVNTAKESGLDAKRAYASNGEALGEGPEVDLMVEGVRIQAKVRAKLAKFLQIPDGCDAVAAKQDFGETLLIMRFTDFLDLLKEAKGE